MLCLQWRKPEAAYVCTQRDCDDLCLEAIKRNELVQREAAGHSAHDRNSGSAQLGGKDAKSQWMRRRVADVCGPHHMPAAFQQHFTC